jgi:hypothetical protein
VCLRLLLVAAALVAAAAQSGMIAGKATGVDTVPPTVYHQLSARQLP